jgi:CRP-like cAMP-binding protein
MKTLENKTHPFLAELDAEQAGALLRHAKKVEFASGQIIFREGDPANRLYLIESGRVAVEWRTPDGAPHVVEEIKGGEVLGWSWLFPPFAWHFQARAIEPTRVIACDGADILVTCETNRILGFEIMKRVAQVLIHRLQATRKQLVAAETAWKRATNAALLSSSEKGCLRKER